MTWATLLQDWRQKIKLKTSWAEPLKLVSFCLLHLEKSSCSQEHDKRHLKFLTRNLIHVCMSGIGQMDTGSPVPQCQPDQTNILISVLHITCCHWLSAGPWKCIYIWSVRNDKLPSQVKTEQSNYGQLGHCCHAVVLLIREDQVRYMDSAKTIWFNVEKARLKT
jgi:hypothetical protein